MRLVVLRMVALLAMVLMGVVASSPRADAGDVNAGPIWDNADAQRKCPAVCGDAGWDGNWHTTAPGVMSVCSCGAAAGSVAPAPIGYGTGCQAPSTVYCSGCTVSCPAGRQAFCQNGEDFGTSGSGVCRTHPKCECR